MASTSLVIRLPLNNAFISSIQLDIIKWDQDSSENQSYQYALKIDACDE